jgi:hypothetical protein
MRIVAALLMGSRHADEFRADHLLGNSPGISSLCHVAEDQQVDVADAVVPDPAFWGVVLLYIIAYGKWPDRGPKAQGDLIR